MKKSLPLSSRSIISLLIVVAIVAFGTITAHMQQPGVRQVDDLNALIDRSDNPFPVEQKYDANGKKIEMPTEDESTPPSANLITAVTYAFTSSSGVVLEDMSSGTTTILGNNLDDSPASGLTALPFDFWLDGVRATQFSVNANGLMRLGNTVIDTAFGNTLNSTTDAPKLAPYFDDLWIGQNGKVHFKTVGTAPNRKLVVEWQNMQVPRVANGSAGAATFQAWLYEGTGVIEYVYGSGMAVNAAQGGYSIGIQSGVATNFVSVTTSGATASYAASNDTQTGAITAGTKYTFTPTPVPVAPTALNFTGVTGSAMTLNWTDNSANEAGFLIYRSTDGVNYTFITQTVANAVTSTQGNLGNNQTYFWRVIAVSEGAVSTTLSGSQATTSGTVCGTISVGPTGTYTSLTGASPLGAFAHITANGLCGNVILELQSTYLSSVETFPAIPPTIGSASATITIRPATGATGLSITGSSATALIDLNGSSFVTIDGRPGGTGATRDMTISNTSTGGPAVRFINGASGTTLEFLQIRGVNTASTGVVNLSTTTAVTGNSNNTIDNNDIRDGATAPLNGISSTGTTTLGLENNNNTASNNSIFNFFSATVDHNGILLGAGNTNWTISGNSIYNTNGPLNITGSSIVWNGIQFSSATGSWGQTVSGNFIGGTAVSGGGGALTFTGSGVIRATRLTTGAQIPTSLQGNTIGNFNLTTSSASTSQAGLGMITGAYNAGNVTPNTITNWTINDTGAATLWRGISVGTGTPAVTLVANNTVSNITNASTSNAQVQGIGIQGVPPAATISGNTVGSTSVANSISMSAAAVSFFGIASSATNTSSSSFTNNTIANITSTGTGAFNMVGISISTGGYSIVGNTVRNLTTASTTTASTIVGINAVSTTSLNQFVSQNTIRSCNSTAPAAGVVLFGIIYTGPTTGASVVSRNFVHSIAASTTSTAAEIDGLRISAGNATFQNNMIRLGFFDDATPTSITTGMTIGGIVETGGTNSIYHNTIYIGGTGVVSASNTGAFLSSLTSGTRAIRDNILANNRQNASGTATNTGALFFTGLTLPSPAGLTMSNNTYFTFDPAATVRNGSAGTSYSVGGWQGASAQDANSFYSTLAQINFVNANGTSSHASPQAVVDLHIASPTAIEGTGVDVGVVDDFDGETRATLTPVDVGADAGSFTALDISAPAITYTAFTNTGSTANRVLAVTITDTTGVAAGGNLPRIYFKKLTDGSYVSTQSVMTGGTAQNGTYNCTIDYSLVGGGSVTSGDTVQYFVVAQDTLGNFGSNPGGATGTSVNTVTAPPATPNSYNIVSTYAGSLNVGTSEAIQSLTNAGGLFAALNAGTVSGNLAINLTSDLTAETGTISLNQQVEEGVGNYTITIQASGAARTISGSNTTALINLNGADRVTFSGLPFGGLSLLIRNTSATTGAAIRYINDASSNSILSCVVEGANTSTSSGVVFFSTGTTTGNLNNSISDSTIRDRSDAAGVPANLIYSAGTSAVITNKGNTISNNQLKNFTTAGITSTSTGNENWTISGNTIFEEAARTTGLTGIVLNALGTNSITLNTVRDLNTSSSVTGMQFGNAFGTTVSRNRILSIPSTSGSSGSLNGIRHNGGSGLLTSVTIVNNQISIVPAFTNSQTITGIEDDGFAGNVFNIYFNSVLVSGTASGSTTWAYQRKGATPTTASLLDNIFFNNRTGGAVNHFAAGDDSANSGSWSSNYNIFVGTGTTAANLMDYGTSSSGTPVSFATWQTGPPSRDANSQASNPGVGSYLTTAMFISDTDLHSISTSPALSTGNATGTSVTTDFDNDPRPATMPDIGADELVQAVAGTIPAGTFYNALTADGDSLGGNVSITNVIYLNGKLTTGANTLAIGCNANVSGGGASNYVIGNLKKTYCATGSKSFEVGTANGFSPVTVNITAGTFPADFTTKAVQGAQPNFAVPAKALSRYWTLTATGVTADLTFSYLDPPDVPGTATEGDFIIFKYNGTFSNPGGTVDTIANTATITGVASFSDWTLAEASAEPCPISTTPTSQNFTSAAGSNSFTVLADGACFWDPGPNAVWITIDSVTKPTGGHPGNGTVNYSVAANTGPARMGTVTVGEQTFTVTQNSGCSFMLSSMSQNFVAAGGMNSVSVTAGAGCMWTAVSNDAFITINSGASGSGNGSVGYTVAANTGPARMGTMTIAGITFNVTQNSGCTFMLAPTSQNFVAAGGMNSVNVTSGTGCAWTAVSNDAFITVNSGTPGSGGGTVNYTVTANTGPARMGTMTIAGITFNVTQDSGCTFMLTPTSQNFTAPGGANSVSVTQTTSCGWTALSNDAFIIIDSGTPGSGNGTVGYHVTANTGPMRSGSMTIAGITFNVTQDAACAFNLSSLSQHFVSTGGMDSVNVITGTGCTWTAVSNDAFIMVTMGASGSGNGTVNYTVAANVGPARMGTMTIAGITFTVSQDSGCMFTLSRNHESFPGNGGSGSVNVIASDAGCPWTASTSATYIHITSGTPGTGNGALQYTVDANPGPTIRSDTITIAGQTYTVYQGIDFLDVPSNNLFYTDIGKLAARGVTLGCGSGNYCPNDSVLREQMAAFILRAKGEFNPPTPASQRFTDVPPANVFYNFIDRLAVLGITVGCNPPSNTMYCPGSAVTREQMSAFLLRGLGEFTPPTPASQRFNDVPPANVFYNFIDRMAVLNITLGCTPDHLFYCPSDPVTRAQMAAFLVRAFDL